MNKSKSAEEFIDSYPEWRAMLLRLRELFLATELEETIKWGIPVYTLEGKNVAGLAAFKEHVAIWFFHGSLLEDKANQLINAQQGVTHAQRQWRFDSPNAIDDDRVVVYLQEAINNQRQGKKVIPADKKVMELPAELAQAMHKNEKLRACFEALAPYRQRDYAEYIREAKQSATKARRLEKIVPLILHGIGLNDKYRC